MTDFLQIVRSSSLSPESLAIMIGVSYSTAKRWINGESQPSQLAQKEIQRILDEMKKV